MDCPFAFDHAGMDNDDAENRENSHPNISEADGTIRKRDRGIRGMAFRFSRTFTGFKFISQHDRINEFNERVGDRILATGIFRVPRLYTQNHYERARVAIGTRRIVWIS